MVSGFMAHPQDAHVVKLLRLACEIADAHAASLFLVNGPVLVPYVTYNLPPEYVAGIGEVRVGSQCCGRAVQSRRPWIVTDMLTDPLFADGRDGAEKSLIRAAFSVPVFQGDEVIASLACHFTAPRVPTAVDIDRNEHFARLIAITLKGRGIAPPKAPICAAPSDSLWAQAEALPAE
jgi:GAF domain-containing protein